MRAIHMRPALAVLLLLAIWGCGSSGPFDYVPVQGTLTYEDGSAIPASGIRLLFRSIDVEAVGNAVPRPAAADIDAQGKFDLATSYKYGDGLVPGRHKVTINYATDEDGNLLVPQEYTDMSATPLVVDTAELPFEIKVPKPTDE